MANILL